MTKSPALAGLFVGTRGGIRLDALRVRRAHRQFCAKVSVRAAHPPRPFHLISTLWRLDRIIKVPVMAYVGDTAVLRAELTLYLSKA